MPKSGLDWLVYAIFDRLKHVTPTTLSPCHFPTYQFFESHIKKLSRNAKGCRESCESCLKSDKEGRYRGSWNEEIQTSMA